LKTYNFKIDEQVKVTNYHKSKYINSIGKVIRIFKDEYYNIEFKDGIQIGIYGTNMKSIRKEKIINLLTMSDKEILKLDFYDFCGTAAIFMSDEEKIKWYRDNDKNKNK